MGKVKLKRKKVKSKREQDIDIFISPESYWRVGRGRKRGEERPESGSPPVATCVGDNRGFWYMWWRG